MNAIKIPVPPRNIDAIITKNLHQSAQDRIKEYTESFLGALAVQSKIQAYWGRDAVVNDRHVDEAFDHIMRQNKRNRLKEGAKIVAGALLGFSAPGSANAYLAKDVNAITFNGAIIVLGLLLLLYGTST